MQLNTFMLILVLIMQTIELVASNLLKSSATCTSENDVFKIAGNIIQHCFREQISNTLLISESNTKFGRNNELFLSFIPFIQFNLFSSNGKNIVKKFQRFRKVYILNETVVSHKNYPITNIAIVVKSYTNFTALLYNLKSSVWWNHEASVVIINENSRSGCEWAHVFLNATWTFNILDGIYLCRNIANEIVLYTLNPYSHLAPTFWKQVEREVTYNTSWALFSHEINDSNKFLINTNSSICNYLYFDKTTNLNGYDIKSVTYTGEKIRLYDQSMKSLDKFVGCSYSIINFILRYINATVTIKIFPSLSYFVNGQPRGPYKDVLSGTSNLDLTLMLLRNHWRLQTYPIIPASLKVATSKDSVNFIDRFLCIFTCKIRLFLLAISIMLIVSLKYVMKRTISAAMLEFISIIINITNIKRPDSLSGKILLISSMYATFILGSWIQSLFSAINTVPRYASLIDSLDDLIQSNLTIYGPAKTNLLYVDKFYGRYEDKELGLCIKDLVHGKRIACMHNDRHMRFFTYESPRVHISKGYLLESGYTFTSSEDWPLLPKFNLILFRMNEAGFLKLFVDREKYYFLNGPTDSNPDIFATISDLAIPFYIIVAGWISGTLVFIIEWSIQITKMYLSRNMK